MSHKPIEPVEVVQQRRDDALGALVQRVPFIRFLGITFELRGDELTSVMKFDEKLIGNPMLPALHGGATSAFLEVTAIVVLSWARAWERAENGSCPVDTWDALHLPKMPRTIDFTVDYLRSGLPRDCYARATINRSGRRYASVQVDGWQDNRSRLFAQATGHFLMPERDG